MESFLMALIKRYIKKTTDECLSKEVFAKRKSGQLDEAYNMALELIDKDPNNIWNHKAHVWCLIDLIKREIENKNINQFNKFISELKSIKIDENDEILTKNVNYVLSLNDPQIKLINQAKTLSKQGRHLEALNIYRSELHNFPDDQQIHNSLGWELYKNSKPLFEQEKINVLEAKKILNEYLKLKNERPSLLHSLFLRYADKLIGNENFNLVAFLKYWDLNNLTQEDYKPYKADNGKIYQSIAEKVIQHAAKDSLNKNIALDIEYILPFLDKAIQKFQDNFWLIYYKAKLLHTIDKSDLAFYFSIKVVKSKINDYWAWGLLGDILLSSSKEKAFSCYCKALLCKTEDKFLINIRLKLAEFLIENSLFNEAKYEIEHIIKVREKEGWKLTTILINYQNSDWYKKSSVTATNNEMFYKKNIKLAESLLFYKLEWLNAIVGEKFTVPDKPNKPKRKIYISLVQGNIPIEVSISENKYDFKSLTLWKGLKVKGEYDNEKRFQLYIIENREVTENLDIFPEYIGVIDHINHEKKIAHFIVDTKVHGILNFSNISFKFSIADTVAIKLAIYKNDREIKYSVLTCKATDKIPNNSIFKNFKEDVSVSNGLGFTSDDIFIDKSIIEKFGIKDGDIIEGYAIKNFNKKKNVWGWKAIKITKNTRQNRV